jgi:hypothetical protein
MVVNLARLPANILTRKVGNVRRTEVHAAPGSGRLHGGKLIENRRAEPALELRREFNRDGGSLA